MSLVRPLCQVVDGALSAELITGDRPSGSSLHHLHSLPSLVVLLQAHDLLLAAGATEREQQHGADDDGDGANAALPASQPLTFTAAS